MYCPEQFFLGTLTLRTSDLDWKKKQRDILHAGIGAFKLLSFKETYPLDSKIKTYTVE